MKNTFTFIFLMICMAISGQNSPGVYTVKNARINTMNSDFGTAFYGDNKVVFAAPKQGFTFNREEHNSQPFLDLYIGEVTEDGQIIKKQKMPGDINSKYHEGIVSFTKDMKTVYFSANKFIKKKKNKDKKKATVFIHLFKASISADGQWTNLEMLPFNGSGFSTGHPVLNRDDTKLYFVSDRPESLGKTDIFVVDIYEDGTFSEPRNLGPKINTGEREMFPFIGKDNVLYFSSDGYPGHGELDVYASKIFDNTVSEPMNLEEPVNSEFDDFAYIIDDHKHRGYFSSNRDGGHGDDDIYSFLASPPIYIECQQEIRGVVRDINTEELIPDALIVLFDADGNKLQSFISSSEEAAFSFQQSCNSNYTLKGYLEGHLIGEMDIRTVNDLDADPLEITFHLDTGSESKPEVLADSQYTNGDKESPEVTINQAGTTDLGEPTEERHEVVKAQNTTVASERMVHPQDPIEVVAGKQAAGTDQNPSRQEVTEASEILNSENAQRREGAYRQTDKRFVENNVDPNSALVGVPSQGISENNKKTADLGGEDLPMQTNSDTESQFSKAAPEAYDDVQQIADSGDPVSENPESYRAVEDHSSDVKSVQHMPESDPEMNKDKTQPLSSESEKVAANDKSEVASVQAMKEGSGHEENAQAEITGQISTQQETVGPGEISNSPDTAVSNGVPTDPIIQINTIYFDFDKFNIRADARIELDKIAGVLQENPETKIKVNAHTDIRGKEHYNDGLSERRASSTVEYLMDKGIDKERISGQGHGEHQLAEKCSKMSPCTGLQHQLNRRAEFLIVDKFSEAIVARSLNKDVYGDYAISGKTPNSGAYVNYDFSADKEVYTVQLGAFKGEVQNDKFSKLKDLFNYRYKDGLNRYYAGIFQTSTEARRYMRDMRQNGFDDAFVVGLKGTSRF